MESSSANHVVKLEIAVFCYPTSDVEFKPFQSQEQGHKMNICSGEDSVLIRLDDPNQMAALINALNPSSLSTIHANPLISQAPTDQTDDFVLNLEAPKRSKKNKHAQKSQSPK